MWRPKNSAEGSLDFELKKTISRRLWDTDGSCGGGEAIVSESDIEYLTGLHHSGIKGANQLIKLINKHHEVILWHEH